MSLFRISLGSLIGSLLSCGLAIGLIYGGIQVSWWLGLILGVIGIIIGGFVAGFISQDAFPGMLAGMITGLVVFAGVFLFFWLVLRVKILDWYASVSDINQTTSSLLDYLGVQESSSLGQLISDLIANKYSEYGSDIDNFVQKYVPVFSLIIGGVVGGGAFLLNAISGFIGGKLNKVDEVVDIIDDD